jgi:8-amino-7-oxononanoate synthase
MTLERKTVSLSAGEKAGLLERLSSRRRTAAPEPQRPALAPSSIVRDLMELDSYEQFMNVRSAAEILDIADPYFRVHDGVAGAESRIEGKPYINFSSYNYLGLNGHPEVSAAAKAAIDRYGSSVSASRLVSGERAIHRELERRLADLHGAEDCLTFVSGHATNVTVIGHLLTRNDLILHDSLIHNCAVQGAQLSGAKRLSFPHNDAAAAEKLLIEHGSRHKRVLIVIEGHYSMDGDIPDLPAFSAMARRRKAWLMVDEAHSVGVVGRTGRGIAEHYGMESDAADLWMGTLSKALAGCGGYIAGRRQLIDYLKLSTPGFVYSVGMSPPVAAAAIAAIDVMQREPERVAKLNAAARLFRDRAAACGLDTGLSAGLGIVPIITGSSITAGRLADAAFRRGVNVQPILYPAVPEQSARLRFFLSSEHTAEQIETSIAILAEEGRRVFAEKTDLAALALKLRRLKTRAE